MSPLRRSKRARTRELLARIGGLPREESSLPELMETLAELALVSPFLAVFVLRRIGSDLRRLEP